MTGGARDRLKALWLTLTRNLLAVPAAMIVLFAALGVGLTEVDARLDIGETGWVFQGDGSAARTVLSVIAGSLITVAGLTFSVTMVVLQLAASQFSPRILRTFFGDRVTQVTIGTYVGTFVYSILVLRAVGSYGDSGFVPRLSITFATLLGIAGVVLLVVFLRHVSQMVQVSHVTAGISRLTLSRTEALFPETLVDSVTEDPSNLLEQWRAKEAPGRIMPGRPGFVQRVELDQLRRVLAPEAHRVALLACPGDFVTLERPLAEVWPAAAAHTLADRVRGAVKVADERDIDQDVGFGLRQLGDIAIKAMSPGINDPATAVTCIGYLRAILVRLTERAAAPAVDVGDGFTLVLRRQAYAEYLDTLRQISRYAATDPWVSSELLVALVACASAAAEHGARDRAHQIRGLAESIAESAGAGARTDADRRQVANRLAEVRAAAGG